MIIYLHGFNSTGPDSAKFYELKEGLPDIQIYAPTYPSNNPDEAIKTISELIYSQNIDEDDELMFVGTSMGGYFAQYLGRKFNAKIVLINPLLLPLQTLQKRLGKNTNFYTDEEYTLTAENIEAFKKYSISDYKHEFGTMLLIDRGDEVIDYIYAYSQYRKIGQCHLYDGGNHRFAHMEQAMPLIEKYYNSIWA